MRSKFVFYKEPFRGLLFVIIMPMKDPKLAKSINIMAQADQKMIKGYRAGKKRWDDSLIRAHTEAMVGILRTHGWPTVAMVGKKANNNAWLLVQHSDHDIALQKKVLRVIKREHKRHAQSIDPSHIAYLEDRIMVKEKGTQLYGTQFKGDLTRLAPIHNPAQLDKRRKALGLETHSSFLKRYGIKLK